MCQLAAYVGDRNAAPILLKSLLLQEGYLGGHSTGLATSFGGSIHMVKDIGSTQEVVTKTGIASLKGLTGIAHSRHTVDAIKDSRCNRVQNAHPWLSEDGSIVMMHNGVITNYEEHWRRLKEHHQFSSLVEELNYITDSEVAIHMLSDKVKTGITLAEALSDTTNRLTGMVLLGAMANSEPKTVYLTNWNQPCYLGIGNGENMFSSRIGLNHVEDRFNIFKAPNNSLIKLTPGDMEVTKLDETRSFPNLQMDIGLFGKNVSRLLRERGELDSFGLLIPLLQRGYDEAYGIEPDKWREIVKLGYGDANDHFEALEQLTKWGRIRRSVKQREEAGIIVPRVMWSAPAD